ncbi:hypothetical protein ARALYDRAFT_917467 [Arabidopsis lyrata subsp. lyrata]|uniref:Uncharacterized protein n=1 Tax=Arabidopsis lyrata subsp. lyrata TaxID=81972 RepID=D7MRH6_ARALL|nr:hypothetical protein ARALYDRAFT_917467 [Arabidopsis lyrata subsp. lyrata]
MLLGCCIKSTSRTFTCVISCGNAPAFHTGIQVHGFVIKSGFLHEEYASTSVITEDSRIRCLMRRLMRIILCGFHCGFLQKRRKLFDCMSSGPNHIDRKIPHYTCMIDILGRYRELKEAVELNMVVKPNELVWLALRSACRLHYD